MEFVMPLERNVDLWGEESIIETNECSMSGCTNPRDNAGNGNYHSLCSTHHKEKYLLSGWNYRQYRKNYCENIDGRFGFKCTTTIIIDAQLTVDHIDGNNKNNNLSNLQTLCFDCHVIKTNVNGDRQKDYRPTEEQRILRWEKFLSSMKEKEMLI